MLQVNPAQLIQMIKSGQNPQQLVLSILEGQMSNTPMGANLLNLAKNGKINEIEQIADDNTVIFDNCNIGCNKFKIVCVNFII